MGHKPIKLTIINDSRADACPGCDGGAMTDRQVQLVAEQLGDSYGDEVQVEKVDLAHGADIRWQWVWDKANEQGAALPVLAVDGVPRLWGRFDHRMAADVIETQREIDGG